MDVRVHPAKRLAGVIDPPGSKNYTTRYLLAAALADGESLVRFPAESEDSRALQACLTALGAELTPVADGLRVRGFGRRPRGAGPTAGGEAGPTAGAGPGAGSARAAGPGPGAPLVLNPGNAGAVLRFLMAVTAVTLPSVTFVTDYADSLARRPQGDLLDALAQLGAQVEGEDGHLPVTIRGQNLKGGRVQVNGSISSQFTSALLFAAPLTGEELTIDVLGGPVSRPPLRQTLHVLREAGIQVEAAPDLTRFVIPGGQAYQCRTYTVPGDYPAAAALLAAAAVIESDVTIRRLRLDDEQGERAAVAVLAAMGADICHDGGQVRVRGGRTLTGGRFDGDPFTDAVLPLVAAATVADGETTIHGVENLRYKECDRISDTRAELGKLGALVEEGRSEFRISGRPGGLEGGVAVESHTDHRVIMALTIAALRCARPVVVREAQHVAKSYPAFFEHLRMLGARIEELQDDCSLPADRPGGGM